MTMIQQAISPSIESNGHCARSVPDARHSEVARKLKASVVIPTCNRVDELRSLIRSALDQTVPVEVIVMDDGATTASGEMIDREFHGVRYYRLASSRGPTFQRNRGIELASYNIVFPVDDDTIFVSRETVEQTLAEFGHPRVAAVGIPHINISQDENVRQRAPEDKGIYVTSAFVGAAHAIRRDVFLKVGGFRERFFYMGEEGDLCLRMMARGYVTRLGAARPMHHLESPRRNFRRAGFMGRRNDVLFTWYNVPAIDLGVHLAGTTVKGLRHAVRFGPFWPMINGTASGYADIFKLLGERRPVDRNVYRLHRSLKTKGPRLLDEIEALLPVLPVEQ